MTSTEALKIMVETIGKHTQGRSAKTAFWQERKYWRSHTFELDNKKLEKKDKQFLESIKEKDPKAVVVNVDDFVEANDDGSILVDDMVNSVLYLYGRRQANISDFLDYYADKEAQQDVMTIKEIVKIMEKRLK